MSSSQQESLTCVCWAGRAAALAGGGGVGASAAIEAVARVVAGAVEALAANRAALASAKAAPSMRRLCASSHCERRGGLSRWARPARAQRRIAWLKRWRRTLSLSVSVLMVSACVAACLCAWGRPVRFLDQTRGCGQARIACGSDVPIVKGARFRLLIAGVELDRAATIASINLSDARRITIHVTSGRPVRTRPHHGANGTVRRMPLQQLLLLQLPRAPLTGGGGASAPAHAQPEAFTVFLPTPEASRGP